LLIDTGLGICEISAEVKKLTDKPVTAVATHIHWDHIGGHKCFWEASPGYLFTGDLVYKDTLFAYYPSTDPQAYLKSLERLPFYPLRKYFLPIIRWIYSPKY
jgi:glyoxylase-like metal-dependent hydrolase (beta-lactamase superfamily II)